MRKITTTLYSLLFILVFCSIAVAGNLKNTDIVGFEVGMNVPKIIKQIQENYDDIIVEKKTFDIDYKFFKIEKWDKITVARQPGNISPNTRFEISANPLNTDEALGITRHLTFQQNTGPDYEDVIRKIKEKYGEPDGTVDVSGGSYKYFFWSSTNTVPQSTTEYQSVDHWCRLLGNAVSLNWEDRGQYGKIVFFHIGTSSGSGKEIVYNITSCTTDMKLQDEIKHEIRQKVLSAMEDVKKQSQKVDF